MSAEKQIITIPDDYTGLRLDKALARMFPEYSRSRLKEWLLAGAIVVEGGRRKHRRPGESVELVEVNYVVAQVLCYILLQSW